MTGRGGTVIGDSARAEAARRVERLIHTCCHPFDGGDFAAVAEMFADATRQLTR
ncbi:hypothetical protein LCD36_18855 [Saccharopolyspora sp. 6T]|uniref:hypothetical protein n=1 Tax=Saccharopolyspora sp. 6T TaxID=2877238 RepID=UPI001CD80E81|nr:hypothetical protein [Saccharopolyspora sp. 6T]MCA1188494.1 hypothetical protein [Saccharopolyspora sp. 6T]